MKIIVDEANSGFHIIIPLPLFVLRSRLIWRATFKQLDEESRTAAAAFARTAVKELTRCVRKNGHFTLIEVNSANGYRVVIYI